MIELGAGRKLGRAEQPRDRQRTARIRKPRADLVGLVPQVARQKAGQKRIAGAEHVVNLDVQSRRDQPVLESVGNAIRKHDATPWAALAHDDRTRQRADPANGAERVLDPGRDVQLLLGPDDQIAIGEHRGEDVGHSRRAGVAAFAGAVPADAPEIGPVIDVEDHPGSVRLRRIDRLALRARGVREREMSARDEDRS